MEPSSNISDKELFRVNGNLPPERIEKILDYKIDPENVRDCLVNIKDAEKMLIHSQYSLAELIKQVRGKNVDRAKDLMHEINMAIENVRVAKSAIE